MKEHFRRRDRASRSARVVESADAEDLALKEPREQRGGATRVPGADHPPQRDPQVREEPQQRGMADENLARSVVARARLVDRPAASDLLVAERAGVETLVAVRHDDRRVEPERPAALEHAER